MDEVLTPALIRAARGLLGLGQAEVAEKAGLHQRTISKLEGELDFSLKDLRRRKALHALKEAFEKEGVEFLFGSENAGEGVRRKIDGTRV